MEPNGDLPPLWSQTTTTLQLLRRRRRRGEPITSIMNPIALTLSILILLLLTFFILPPFLSQADQILTPNSVKKRWDVLNILLVLLAILCGFFAKRNEEPSSNDDNADAVELISELSNTFPNFANETKHTSVSSKNNSFSAVTTTPAVESGGLKLRTNGRTYPDLREESLWGVGDARELRFSDDSEVNFYRLQPPENSHRCSRRSYRVGKEESETLVREIPRESFQHNSAPTQPKSPAPPQPPPSAAILKKRPTFHKKNVERQKNEKECTPAEVESGGLKLRRNNRTYPDLREESLWGVGDISELRFSDDSEVNFYRSQPPENFQRRSRQSYRTEKEEADQTLVRHEIPREIFKPSSAPTLPKSRPNVQLSEDRIDKIQIKMSETTKEIATAITSLYKNQIKRKTKVKTREILDSETRNSSPPSALAPTSTPPPPPPPPPPHPSKMFQNLFKKSDKCKQVKKVTIAALPPPEENFRLRHVSSGKPPKHLYNESVLMAAPSRLFPMPPPPPPPPFKAAPEFKFVAREDVEVTAVKPEDRNSTMPSSYCPSPDVNAKADTFIARLRDGWKLDKINSFNEREGKVAEADPTRRINN